MAGGAAAGGAVAGGGTAGGTRVARAGAHRGHPASRAAVAKSSPTVGAGPPRPGRAGAASEDQAAVVPRQLPAGVAHFAGRTAELAELQTWQHEAASADGTAKVLVIGGTAGAGKTALAVHWAHHSAAEFPDGQLYVNLRGFDASGTPVAPGDALRWFLGAFGVTEEQIPDSIDAQSALYRSVLAGKRVLVILDNARDAAQVRPLLPGSRSCLALVTSRARLPGLAATEGARLVPLDVLTADEAHELLASRLGERARAEADAAQQLTEACSRLPLALSIVAARVAARPYLPLAHLARELADAQGRLEALDAGDPVASIRAVFSWSCEQLSPPAARMFRLLGLHAGPDVTIAAAASLAGVDRGQAAAAVAELADAHLIAEHAPGRYAFHDLLRAYAAYLARDTDSDAERREAVVRVLDYYLHTASAGSRVLNPVRPRITLEPPQPGVVPELLSYASETLAWFEAERQVLIAAIAQASDGGFDQHAWQLPPSGWVLKAHRIGGRMMWQAFAERADSAELEAADITDAATLMWEVHDLCTQATAEGFAQEASERLLADHERRSALLELLLRGPLADRHALTLLVSGLRLPTEGPYLAVVTEAPDAGVNPMPDIEVQLRAHGHASAWQLLPDALVGLVHVPAGRVDALHTRLARYPDQHHGLSPAFADLALASSAVRMARIALAGTRATGEHASAASTSSPSSWPQPATPT